MKILPNIYMLESTKKPIVWNGKECYSMVYAIIEADGISLIDTGFPDRGLEILAELREIGKRKRNVKQIFLTHSDLDHMGNAAWIQEKMGCPVWISAEELVYTDGRKQRFGEKQKMAESFGLKNPRFSLYPPEGQIDNFEILPTPGHSLGHVSILYNRKVLFGGDLFSCQDGYLKSANPDFSEDIPLALESLKKVLGLHYNILCPAHGEPIKRINLKGGDLPL